MFGFWEFGQEKKLHIHISRQKDICFTLIYGPFAGKINNIFAAQGRVKDPVLFKSHSMNLKQDISSNCLKTFPQFGFLWKKNMQNDPGVNSKSVLADSSQWHLRKLEKCLTRCVCFQYLGK